MAHVGFVLTYKIPLNYQSHYPIGVPVHTGLLTAYTVTSCKTSKLLWYISCTYPDKYAGLKIHGDGVGRQQAKLFVNENHEPVWKSSG